jgi:hypothetical protein
LPAPPPPVKNAHVIISLTNLAIMCGENVYVFATKVQSWRRKRVHINNLLGDLNVTVGSDELSKTSGLKVKESGNKGRESCELVVVIIGVRAEYVTEKMYFGRCKE